MVQLTIHLTVEADESIRVTGDLEGQPWEHRVTSQAVRTSLQKVEELRRNGSSTCPGQAEVGCALRDTFVKPLYENVLNPVRHDRGRLLVTANDPGCLGLPWELLPGPAGDFICTGGRWTVLRSTRPALLPPSSGLVIPPLRILFCACAPTDLRALDYEREEEAILRIAEQLKGKVHVDIIESGTLEELAARITETKPHIVHLSGQCALKGKVSHFAFESESGLSDLRSMPQIADRLFIGKGVRLLFLTGCQGGQVAASALCQGLTAMNQVPVALVWPISLADEIATQFTRGFLIELVQGRTVDSSVNAARRGLYPSVDDGNGEVARVDAGFSWQQIYASEDDISLVDPMRTPDAILRSGVRYELVGDNICGLREGFVGRRRLLQRARPALSSGGKRVLLLTGICGSGKSTIAARLSSLCKRDGFQIVAVQARRNDASQFCLRLLAKLADGCHRLSREEDRRILSDGQRPVEDRLHQAVEILNKARILLLLDNLEELLPSPPAPQGWTDPVFAGFFRELIGRLTGEGRVILTCSQVPDGFDSNQPNLAREPLPNFTAADFLKYARRHDEVATRMERGELSYNVVATLHRKVGVTPRFVKQACAALAKIDAPKLAELIERVPEVLSPEEQQTWFRDLFLPQLYQALPPESRLGLSRLAVAELPLPIDGVARVSALPGRSAELAADQWFALGLVLRFGGENTLPLYTVHPLQREFFVQCSLLSPDQAKAAHLAAAAFFQDCFEVNREDEIRVSVASELLACLRHATEAGDNELRRWAALRLSRQLQGTAEFRAARELIEPLLHNGQS